MRKVLVVNAVIAVAVLATAGAAGGDRRARSVKAPARLSFRVPAGWHVLRGWLSDITDPVPSLAVASFKAKLSHRTCECGFPNVVNFPRNGAFVFVWEYPHPSRRALAHTPKRPIRIDLAGNMELRRACYGPSDTFVFKDAARVFQVEVYLGPGIGPALRERTEAMLNSLRVTPRA